MTSSTLLPNRSPRVRTWGWVIAALVVLGVVAAVTSYLTAPRPGGLLDPDSTGDDGTHALIALLEDAGVDVVIAHDVADVERAATPDTLLVVGQTYYTPDDDLLARIAEVPGDRLLLQPGLRTRESLAPEITRAPLTSISSEPDCDLEEAQLAGSVEFASFDGYEAAGSIPVTTCYGGALVRYDDGERTVTVVSDGYFLTNRELLTAGNAALAMNLAGTNQQMIWYAPQSFEQGQEPAAQDIEDLIPERVSWIVWQLWFAVALVALWKARRIGPLVTEQLPVVVRASETVEGRGRLYRSRRARDRASESLRTATLQRLVPRLGLGHTATPHEIVTATATRVDIPPQQLNYLLYGPPPETDDQLVQIANALDDIERQVTYS